MSRRSAKLADEIYSREEIWTAQDHIGRALVALGQPAEARNSFLAAIKGIESLRREVAGGEQQQQSFLENRLSPWFDMIDLLVSQQKYAEALTFAEQSKARVLLDALQTGRVELPQVVVQRRAGSGRAATTATGFAQLAVHDGECAAISRMLAQV